MSTENVPSYDETAVEWTPVMQELTAADVMTRDVAVVAPETPLREVAERLTERHVSAVPVVDENGTVVGIVSETDLIDEDKRRVRLPRTLLYGDVPILEQAVREAYDEGASLTASDVMTRNLVTAPETTSARAVAEVMVRREVNHVPVTREGRLVGIIARADILRAVQAQWERRARSGGED